MVSDACGAYLHSHGSWERQCPIPSTLLQAALRNWMVRALVILVMAVALLWKPTPWTPAARLAIPARFAYFVTSVWLSALLAPLCLRYLDLLHAVQTGVADVLRHPDPSGCRGQNGRLAEPGEDQSRDALPRHHSRPIVLQPVA